MNFGKKPDVRRVGSSLVVTLSKANPPLIWRFDLERNHSFTLALQGQDNEWELGVTSPRGEFTPVARFPLREDAEEALAAISASLTKTCFRWVGVFFKVIGILALLAAAALWGWSALQNIELPHLAQSAAPIERAEAPAPEQAPAQPAPNTKNGIPLPADEVLQAPSP
jgi:hypothetical protein